MFRYLSSVGGWMVLVILALLSSSVESIAFLSKKKTYTPLLFFKVPKGNMDECEYVCIYFAKDMLGLFVIRYIVILELIN